jgi:DHA1 family multidrug resistance protein-like MFS transporter
LAPLESDIAGKHAADPADRATARSATVRPVSASPRPVSPGWRRIVAAYWVTQLVESLGMSQVFALLPAHLRELGVAEADRIAVVGLLSSLVFVLGLPLVPLWGVWADKYSRKAVIVRSAVVEAVVFTLVAAAQQPWQVAVALMLVGLQLGNTGVMLAGIRDVVPRRRLGTSIAAFGAASPVGFALGPIIAAVLIDGVGVSISGVYAVAAGLSVATALLVGLGTREIRPEVVPTGPAIRLAFDAVRGVVGDHDVRRLFAVYGVVFLANQVSRPYTPLLVEQLVGTGAGLASAIAIVIGLASMIGALTAPVAGWAGDRAGYRPVLIVALLVGAAASVAMPVMAHLVALAGASLLLGAAVATVGAMVFSLLATEVPPERRSATLNLVYLPLYLAGIVGPATGSLLAASVGLPGPYLAGGTVFVVGAVVIARHRARVPASDAVSEAMPLG